MGSGFANGTMYADNVNFSGAAITPTVTADGQLLIGSTATPNIKVGTLTAGTGISVTNASGSITIAATGGGFTVTEVTGTSVTMVKNTLYLLNNAGLVTATLPSTSAIGDMVWVIGKGAGGWKIAQPNAGTLIHFGNVDTTTGVGGSLASTNQYDAIQLMCTTTNAAWTATGVVQGNITIV